MIKKDVYVVISVLQTVHALFRERHLLDDFAWDKVKLLRFRLGDGIRTEQNYCIHALYFLAKGPGCGVEWANNPLEV